MEITREKTGELTASIKVKVDPADYQSQVNSVLKDYAKKAQIKGFRAGKVPVSVVRRMYGKSVVFEELNKIISQSLSEYIEAEKLPLVGEPLPTVTDIELDAAAESSYEFDYELGLAPEFTMDYGLTGNDPVYNINIDDETLDKEIVTLQKTYGPMNNPEVSQEGDILFGKIMEIDAEGNVVEEGYSKMMPLNPERIEDEALLSIMGEGKKPEDSFTLNIEQALRNDHEIRRFWENNVQNEKVRDISDEDLEAIKGKQFKFEVRKINRIEPMEVGQELFDKAFGEGNVTTEEEFRDRVKADMDKFFDREGLRFYRSKAIKNLIDGTTIPLPDEFLRRWLMRAQENATEGNIDEMYDSYSRSLRWKLMVDKMKGENPAVNVEEADLRVKAEEMVKTQFASMLTGDNENQLETFVNYYMQDEKLVNRMFDELIEERIFDHLNDKNPPVSEEISAADFMEKLKAER